MEEQFVTYNVALELKKLGFDKSCFALFTATLNNDNFDNFFYSGEVFDFKRRDFVRNSWLTNEKSCSAPLWQQAIDWFREEHGIIISNSVNADFGFYNFQIRSTKCDRVINWFTEYEIAREQGILKAIEIIKSRE